MIDKDNGFNKIQSELEKLERLKLIIYVDDTATYENGIKIDFIAALMEYGNEGFSVPFPARPFFRSTFDAYHERYSKRFERGIEKIISEESTAHKVLEDLGKYVVRTVREMIRKGSYVALSAETIKRKNSTQPLVDTKLLYRSIKYKIE